MHEAMRRKRALQQATGIEQTKTNKTEHNQMQPWPRKEENLQLKQALPPPVDCCC